MQPVDELWSVTFSDFSINSSTRAVSRMAITSKSLKLLYDFFAIGENLPWLFDWFSVDY
jgi:hypothetical protein